MGGFLCKHLNNHVSLSACLCASQSVISSLNESTLEVKVCPPIPLPSSRHTNKHRHTFIHKTFTTSLPETTESSENCSEFKKNCLNQLYLKNVTCVFAYLSYAAFIALQKLLYYLFHTPTVSMTWHLSVLRQNWARMDFTAYFDS